MFYVPERRIQRAGAVISVFLSAVLLIGAIVCLMLTSNSSTSIIIGMIVLFTCLFAIIIGLLTNAGEQRVSDPRLRRVFHTDLRLLLIANTRLCRYAAILVVFVSNNIGGGRS